MKNRESREVTYRFISFDPSIDQNDQITRLEKSVIVIEHDK